MATASWLFVTFGEVFQNILMFQAVMRLEHFSVTSPKNLFRSIASVKGADPLSREKLV
jgi:hypothetical protein